MLTIQKKSLKVGKFVNTEHVDKTIRTYKQERWVHNSKRIGKEDSLTVWYSVEELEEFLAAAKSHGADGVKFCFAAYPMDYTPNPDYAGRQTIVMVATKSKETENGTVNKEVFVNTAEGTSILAYNVGKLCPPYCGPKTTDEDDWGGIGVSIVDKGEDGLVVI